MRNHSSPPTRSGRAAYHRPTLVPAALAIGLGLATSVLGVTSALAQEPSPAYAASAPVSGDAARATVHLLTNGDLVHGVLEDAGNEYTLRHKLGKFQFPKSRLSRSFRSVEDVYEVKKAELPPRDPDEAMKLARWCLTQGLKLQAKEQLAVVLALVPKQPQALAMLEKIKGEEERVQAQAARRDPEVMTTSGSIPSENRNVASRPEELASDPTQRRMAQGMGLNTPPVIFDLPPAMALKKAQEYERWIHPQLQRYCAGCHNERSGLTFQLVQTRSANRLKGEVLRFNLDATLGLVDADAPSRSLLLVNALMPHPPTNKPILNGPSHPTYLLLVNWVNSLRPGSASPAETLGAMPAVTAPLTGPGTSAGTETFAADRANPVVANPGLPNFARSAEFPAGASMPPLPLPIQAAGAASAQPRVPGERAEGIAAPSSRSMTPAIVPTVGLPPVPPGGGPTAPSDPFPVPFILSGEKPMPPMPMPTQAPSAVKPQPNAKDGSASSKGDASKAAKPPRKVKHIDPDALEKLLRGSTMP